MVLRGSVRFCPLRTCPRSHFQCPPFRGERALDRSELGFRLWQILLQKSAATDRAVMPFVKGHGFDPPALTPSTQLQRYAVHRA